MLGHAFVNTFISPANKNDSFQLRVAPRRFLAEQFSRRGQQNDRRLRIRAARLQCLSGARPSKRLHGFKQWRGLQHHAFAAAERPVIHGAVTVLGKLAQVLHADLYQAAFSRPAHDAVVQRPRKKLGENRNQIESHAKQV